MKLKDINLRDPYILPFDGKYYMYGTRGVNHTGFDVFVSEDLEIWSKPKSVFEGYGSFWADKEFWAPEVYEYNSKFIMFATFNSDNRNRGTQVLIAESPLGPFKEHSAGGVTPEEWESLDGTLYVEDGIPYMVFCHEWTQIGNGTVCYMRLSDDLKEAVSEPKVLWSAKDACCFGENSKEAGYITDGPFLLNICGELICIWSTICKGSYLELIARSDNGRIDGNWSIDKKALFEDDGGHGMIFKTFDNKHKFVYHSPNVLKEEHPCIMDINVLDLKNNNK